MSSNTGTSGAANGTKAAPRTNKSSKPQAPRNQSKGYNGNRSQKRQKQVAAEPAAAGEDSNVRVSKAVRQQVNQFKSMFPQWNGATLQDVLQLFAECGNDFSAACDAVIGGYNTKQPPDSWKEVPTKAQKSKEVALKKQRAKQQARQRSNDTSKNRDRRDDSRGRRPEGGRPARSQPKQQNAAPEQRSVTNPTNPSSAPVAATAPQETQKSQPIVQAFPKPVDYASAAKAGQQAWSQQQSPADAQSSADGGADAQTQAGAASQQQPPQQQAQQPAQQSQSQQQQQEAQKIAESPVDTTQQQPVQQPAQQAQAPPSGKPQSRVVLPGGYNSNDEVQFRFGVGVGSSFSGNDEAGAKDAGKAKPSDQSQAKSSVATQSQVSQVASQQAQQQGQQTVPGHASSAAAAVPFDMTMMMPEYQMQMAQMQAMDPEAMQAMGYVAQSQFMQSPYGFDGSESGHMHGRMPHMPYYDSSAYQAYQQGNAKYQGSSAQQGQQGSQSQAGHSQASPSGQSQAGQGQGGRAFGASSQGNFADANQSGQQAGGSGSSSGSQQGQAAAAHFPQQSYSPIYYPAYMGQFPAYQAAPSQYPPHFGQTRYFTKGFNPAGFNSGYPGVYPDEDFSKNVYGGAPQQSYFMPESGTPGQQTGSSKPSSKPGSGPAKGAPSYAQQSQQQAQGQSQGQDAQGQFPMGGQGYMRGNSAGNYYVTPFGQGGFNPSMQQPMGYQQAQQQAQQAQQGQQAQQQQQPQ